MDSGSEPDGVDTSAIQTDQFEDDWIFLETSFTRKECEIYAISIFYVTLLIKMGIDFITIPLLDLLLNFGANSLIFKTNKTQCNFPLNNF